MCYAIPIDILNKSNKFMIYKLGKDQQKEYRIENSPYNSTNAEISKILFAIKSIQEDKILLNQFAYKKNNILIFDENIFKDIDKRVHDFHEYKITEEVKILEHSLSLPNQKDISFAAISADLMSAGCIVMMPIQEEINTDLIIEQKYYNNTTTH